MLTMIAPSGRELGAALGEDLVDPDRVMSSEPNLVATFSEQLQAIADALAGTSSTRTRSSDLHRP